VPRPPMHALVKLAAPVALLSIVACGHPATRGECEEIFQRSAEIELQAQSVTDPAEVKRRTEEFRAARGDKLLEECVGKRITDSAMDCVRNAKDAASFDACLD
jgi:hypothetical protein